MCTHLCQRLDIGARQRPLARHLSAEWRETGRTRQQPTVFPAWTYENGAERYGRRRLYAHACVLMYSGYTAPGLYSSVDLRSAAGLRWESRRNPNEMRRPGWYSNPQEIVPEPVAAAELRHDRTVQLDRQTSQNKESSCSYPRSSYSRH